MVTTQYTLLHYDIQTHLFTFSPCMSLKFKSMHTYNYTIIHILGSKETRKENNGHKNRKLMQSTGAEANISDKEKTSN